MTPAAHLSDAELERPLAALSVALGRSPTPSEIARVHRRPDGIFVMATYRPIIPTTELRGDVDHPWRHVSHQGMNSSTSFESIEAVAALLNDPMSDEAEVRRRAGLLVEAERQLEENRVKQKADAMREDQERTAEHLRTERAFADFRGADWGRLNPLSKLAYALALAADDGADLGAELRRLAKSIERGAIPLPRARWW